MTYNQIIYDLKNASKLCDRKYQLHVHMVWEFFQLNTWHSMCLPVVQQIIVLKWVWILITESTKKRAFGFSVNTQSVCSMKIYNNRSSFDF